MVCALCTSEITSCFTHSQNELREEVRIYREYLAEQAHEEEQREKELDTLVNCRGKELAKWLDQWRINTESIFDSRV